MSVVFHASKNQTLNLAFTETLILLETFASAVPSVFQRTCMHISTRHFQGSPNCNCIESVLFFRSLLEAFPYKSIKMEKFMETTKQAGHAKELKRLKDSHEVFKDAIGGLFWLQWASRS